MHISVASNNGRTADRDHHAMPFKRTLFNSIIGADGSKYNYVGLGFDPADKRYLILC